MLDTPALERKRTSRPRAPPRAPSAALRRKSMPTIPIGNGLLRVAFASFLAAASQPEAACASNRGADTTAVENVRALLSSACRCTGATSHGRYLRCAKGIVRAALRGGPIPRPVPAPVAFRQEPEGVTLGDPAFEALPGARA